MPISWTYLVDLTLIYLIIVTTSSAAHITKRLEDTQCFMNKLQLLLKIELFSVLLIHVAVMDGILINNWFRPKFSFCFKTFLQKVSVTAYLWLGAIAQWEKLIHKVLDSISAWYHCCTEYKTYESAVVFKILLKVFW